MHKEFLKFQLSKDKMNELKGGAVYACKCSNSTEIFVVAQDTVAGAVGEAMQWCGDNSVECVPGF
ncbi:hypothetical protein DW036_25170 [Bacteroides sp. AF39-11AC]|jgi:hypothetical protein|nr:hypothetical protein DW036_25170 [Bacteroides sp. AF39-11AC]